MSVQRSIELPEHLAQRLDAYLQTHPKESLSSLVIDILEMKLQPRDLSKLLELSGIVTESSLNAAEHAEDTL
ncbi:hypothetical protein C7B76_27720 [filamentous cyanobacterium CCP2]|nr:hypothetical protein C7B76_27720 [filamentous cyanobacterium CCP2]